ncbi:hypothetical protein [Amphritea sp.]|uniref:hypothetical protein n=1 Tax=Amphritea sp. TaxID=1872502 RepID=UPI0025BBE445|nr:hypothetical protein [Amphritea sp.]
MSSQPLNSSLSKTDEPATYKHYGIYWFILAGALLLLFLLPIETPWVNTKRGWFIQPMFGSSLGILLVAIFSAVRVMESVKSGYLRDLKPLDRLIDTLSSYRTALFSALLFFLYINTLSVLGFVLSTLIFILTLLWLSRLFERTWVLASLFTITVMVLIFRVGLSVWLPDVWLYSLLPDTWTDFANQYL